MELSDALHDKVKLKRRSLTEVMEEAMGISRGDSLLVPEEVCSDILREKCLVCLRSTEG